LQTLLLFFMANPGAEQGGAGSLIATWGMLIPLFLIMYLLLIRPQRKRQKEHEKLLSELKKGDRVVTNGGMFGTIFAINEEKNIIVLKLAEDVKVEFLKSSIAGRVE
jgi:preprotein translocase subunit YajC